MFSWRAFFTSPSEEWPDLLLLHAGKCTMAHSSHKTAFHPTMANLRLQLSCILPGHLQEEWRSLLTDAPWRLQLRCGRGVPVSNSAPHCYKCRLCDRGIPETSPKQSGPHQCGMIHALFANAGLVGACSFPLAVSPNRQAPSETSFPLSRGPTLLILGSAILPSLYPYQLVLTVAETLLT